MRNLILFAFILCLVGCTENQKAKEFGGAAEITLPANQKLINCTWKDSDLWYLTRPMTVSDTAAIYIFQEESDYGVWEGAYIITEVKK